MKLFNTAGFLTSVSARALHTPVFRLFNTKTGALRPPPPRPAQRYIEEPRQKNLVREIVVQLSYRHIVERNCRRHCEPILVHVSDRRQTKRPSRLYYKF